MNLRSLALLCCAALPLGAHQPVRAAAPDMSAVVAALGRINGRALACGHREVTQRARAIVIARVAKTRELGAAFEEATQQVFLAQGGERAACPSRAALAVELETTARPLAPPASHTLTQSPEQPDIGINPRYLLQAANGRAIMDGDFRKQFQLITFGYTFCPDICPTTLLEMAEILKQLDAQAALVQPLFFSVDPERDTLEQLRNYVEFFDKRIVPATGKPDLVRRAAENFKVRYEKVAAPGAAAANYAVDHSAGMFLLAPGGQFIAKFPYGMPVAEIVARLRQEIALRQPAPEAAQ